MTTVNKITPDSTPIFCIGAGGIVNTAHLPAYRLAGYTVGGIYDLDQEKAAATAQAFSISAVFGSLKDMLSMAGENAVFDLAVPATAMPALLDELPDRANVLIQKPMGANLAASKRILDTVRRKKMKAGVNFQLRYAPFIKEARTMIANGFLGDLVDIEININVYTPWQLWDFLFESPRVEILYHSIHYIDLVRVFMGNPETIYAKTTGHPAMKQLASVRSNIIMDYGHYQRANILTNHCHAFGNEKQHSYIKLEGTTGAIRIGLGVLQNYPDGVADTFEYVSADETGGMQWKSKTIDGSWFPHAFIGSMEQVMLAAQGLIGQPDNSVEDAIHTMACVEAAYRSSEKGGVKPAID